MRHGCSGEFPVVSSQFSFLTWHRWFPTLATERSRKDGAGGFFSCCFFLLPVPVPLCPFPVGWPTSPSLSVQLTLSLVSKSWRSGVALEYSGDHQRTGGHGSPVRVAELAGAASA